MTEKLTTINSPCRSINDYLATIETNKTVYDIFPTAGELKTQKIKEKTKNALQEIYLLLKETDSSQITYHGELSCDCVQFLEKKGYQVIKKQTSSGGESTVYYIICY